MTEMTAKYLDKLKDLMRHELADAVFTASEPKEITLVPMHEWAHMPLSGNCANGCCSEFPN